MKREYPDINPLLVETIREEVDARNWDVSQLARALNSSEYYARKLLGGGIKFRPVTAHRLSSAFGISVEFFQNMQESKVSKEDGGATSSR